MEKIQGEKKLVFGMSNRELLVYGILVALAIFPFDPTDVFDFGTPIIEVLLMGLYWLVSRRKMLGKGD